MTDPNVARQLHEIANAISKLADAIGGVTFVAVLFLIFKDMGK